MTPRNWESKNFPWPTQAFRDLSRFWFTNSTNLAKAAAHNRTGWAVNFMRHLTSSQTMPFNVGAARAQLVEQIRKAPRSPTPSDPVSYLGSPVPVLGLHVPTLRTILATFAKTHRDLTASEVNSLAAALWSGEVLEEKAL